MGTFLVPPRRQPALPILYWNKVFIWYVPMYTTVHGVQTRTFWIEIHVFYHDFIKKNHWLALLFSAIPKTSKGSKFAYKVAIFNWFFKIAKFHNFWAFIAHSILPWILWMKKASHLCLTLLEISIWIMLSPRMWLTF